MSTEELSAVAAAMDPNGTGLSEKQLNIFNNITNNDVWMLSFDQINAYIASKSDKGPREGSDSMRNSTRSSNSTQTYANDPYTVKAGDDDMIVKVQNDRDVKYMMLKLFDYFNYAILGVDGVDATKQ